MGQYLRDKASGQMHGMVGDGKTAIPTSADTPVPPPTPAATEPAIGTYDFLTRAYQSLSPPAAEPAPAPARRRCSNCGEWAASDHACDDVQAAITEGLTRRWRIRALVTGGAAAYITAVTLFAGGPAVLLCGAIAVVFIAGAYRKQRKPDLDPSPPPQFRHAAFTDFEKNTRALAGQMNIPGTITVIYDNDLATTGGLACARRLTSTLAEVRVGEDLLGWTPDEQHAILAHELAHLRLGPAVFHRPTVTSRMAIPVMFGAAGAATLAGLPVLAATAIAAGLATVTYLTGQAMARREERAAVRCGERKTRL
jgi:hypothetical protein